MQKFLVSVALLLSLAGCGSSVDVDPRESTGQPVITPAAGRYDGDILVEINPAESNPDAVIYYTTDGTTPSSRSRRFTEAFSLTESATIKAISIAPDLPASRITRADFQIGAPITDPEGTVDAPQIFPPGGEFADAQLVELSSATAGAAIHYTIDGSTPTVSSPVYSEPLRLTDSRTLKAFATAEGMTDSLLSAATFRIGNALPIWQALADQTLTAGVASVIAVAATDPDGAAPLLSADISALPGSPTFTAADNGTATLSWTPPANLSGTFSITLRAADVRFANRIVEQVLTLIVQPTQQTGTVSTPVISPAGGLFEGAQVITLSSATPGAALYYTLDGSVPTSSSTRYSSAFTLSNSATLNVLGLKDGLNTSPISSASFTIGNQAPVWTTPTAQTVEELSTIDLTLSATDADGTTPILTTNLSALPGTPTFTDNGNGTARLTWTPPAGSEGSYTLTLTATDGRFAGSQSATTLQITVTSAEETAVAQPVISPNGGSFLSSQQVTLTTDTADASIYYTLDGTTPTSGSTLYTAPFMLTESAEIRVIGIKVGNSDSSVAEASFSIGNQNPIWATLPPATVVEGDTLTLTLSASDADGTPPALSADLSNLTGGPVFTDKGNGSATLRWKAPAASAGDYTVELTASDARFSDVKVTQLLTITVEAAPIEVDGDAFLQSFYSDGKIVMEAEHYAALKSSANSHAWVSQSTLGGTPTLDNFGSGDSVMVVSPSNSTVISDYVRDGARMDFLINFKKTGTYYVWIRGIAENTSRVVHFGVNGQSQASATGITGLQADGNWGWTNQRKGTSQVATINVTDAGEQTLNLWMERSGITVDKILLTPDDEFTPKGFGPQENARGKLPTYPVTADSHLYSWNFNEDPAYGKAVDTVGKKNLTCSQCPASVSSLEKKAFSFGGAQSLTLAAQGNLNFAKDQGFAVEAMIRTTDACNTAQQIVGRSEGNTGRIWYLACESRKAVAYAADTTAGSARKLTSSQTIADGKWHHVALIVDPIFDELRLYIDGEEDEVGALNVENAFTSTAPLTVGGGNAAGAPASFRGELDSLAIHNRPLRADEIQRHADMVDKGLIKDLWGCETPVRIMPLGDSITAGTNAGGAERWGSYRPFLYESLLVSGYSVDFVGSYTGRLDDEPDLQHEGWPGITPTKVATVVDGWLEMNPPEMVLMHLGTNSLSSASASQVDTIISNIQIYASSVPIVVGKIINRQTFNGATRDFNNELGTLVTTRINNRERLYLVNHESALNYSTDMYNSLHPNTDGAEKMAIVWLDALYDILPRCRAAAPSLLPKSGLKGTPGSTFRFWPPVSGHPIGTFSLESKPAGMQINPKTGEIRWNNATAGNQSFKVKVSNSKGNNTRTYTVNISN